ncbi:MAG: glycosyltransferase [Clostridiaceae bacterium]|nr:glycosyltransferase [Clostridiaceae bacterium]
MEQIAVLIPCYNEEKTIKKVIIDFKKELPEAKIYVYNNNSTDQTEKIAKENGAIVKNEYEQGKGNVIKSMFHDIEADIYVVVDGDDTYPANRVHELINAMKEKNVDIVIGDRLSNGSYKKQNNRYLHGFGNNLVKEIINSLYQTKLKDIMTGYRVLSKKIVKNINITSKKFEIETEMTIEALENGYSIEEIPVEYKDRPQGSYSKVHTLRDGAKILKYIFKSKKFKKKIMKYIAVFFIMILLFFSLLISTSIFSSENIKDNIKDSSDILIEEGNAKKQYILHRNDIFKFDNYTDALMINNAYSIDNKDIINSALLARKNYIPRSYRSNFRRY